VSDNTGSEFFPELTPTPDTSEPACGYTEAEPGTSGTEPCGQSPAWHIAWRLASPTGGAQCAFVCDDHMRAVVDSYVYADRHTFGPNCGMPGTVWWRSWMGKAECVVVADEAGAK
jgi:hypothetical protein